jgi:signal peptidase II
MANGSPWANVVFGIVSFSALIAISVLWRKSAFPTALSKTAAALLISGILGNLTDRLARGSVVDFLDFHWAGRHFANFNVADSCICVAAGLIFISAFLPEKADQPAGAGEVDPQ